MACVEIKQKEARESFYLYSCRDYSNVSDSLRNYCNVYFYNRGVYGWNCHIFPITKTIALSMGYRPFGKSDKQIDEMVKHLDEAIKGIDKSVYFYYSDYIEEVGKLIDEFSNNVEDYVFKRVINGEV